LSWVPLLDDVINVGFAQTELTLTITGAARASSIEQMIVYLLRGPRRIGRPFSFLRTSIGSTTRQRRFCGRLRVVC
jgi:hypothetical protein